MARGNTIALVMSSLGKQQTDRDTPLDLADLNMRINVTSPNWVETAKTIEEILDCVGEEVVSKEVTRVIYRLPIEGEFIPAQVAPIVAYALGNAADPTGATANTIITVTPNATDGTYTLTLEYDGFTQTTTPIPWDASASVFKRIIEELDYVIGYGNTTVGLAGGVYTIEFVGKRGSALIPVFTADETDLTTTGVDITQTQAGGQRAHNITETSGYQPPWATFGIAFEDEEGTERVLIGAVVDNFTATGGAANGKVTFTADLIIRQMIEAPGLTIPACSTNNKPIRTADCILTHNAVDITEELREFAVSFSNNTLTGNSAHTSRGVRPTRLERAKRRTRSLTYTLAGGVVEDLYIEAKNNPEADVKRADALRVGTAGNNLTFNYPHNLTELATGQGGLAFDQESEEALSRFVATPTKQGSTPPSNVVAYVPNTTRFLTSV